MEDYLKLRDKLECEILQIEQDIEEAIINNRHDTLITSYQNRLARLKLQQEENDRNLQLCQ